MELVLHLIGSYGYAGLFSLLVLGIVGLPVPDETLLTFAGYLVYTGEFRFAPALAAGFLGSACGMSVSYLIGHTTGYCLVHRFGGRMHITEERLGRVHNWFERFGRWALPAGYFVPGVRHLTALVAGASKLEYPVFAAFAYSGAFLWSATFIVTGYLVGERWTELAGKVRNTILVSGAVAAALIFYILQRRYRAKRK